MGQTVRESSLHLPLRVLGPVEAGYGRLNGKYRRRLLLKCKDTAEMRGFVRKLLSEASADPAFRGISVYADMNGDCGV